MHPDFKKILQQFKDRYGDEEGENLFYAWINKRKLDDTKPYSTQAQLRESFNWAKPLFSLFKKDRDAKYYRVEAGFPVNSMNENIYTEDELLRATASLPGKHIDLNHNLEQKIGGVEIVAANYEDGAVETVLRVLKDAKLPSGKLVVDAIDGGEIDHVSIEADCEGAYERADGYEVVGLKFTGLALLDQEALPGIPLTRLMPLESIREGIFNEVKKITENSGEEKVAEKVDEESQDSAEEQIAKLNEKIAEKDKALAEKDEAIAEQNSYAETLKDKLAKTKAKLKEVEGRLRETEKRVSDRDMRIDEIEKDVDKLREDLGRAIQSRENAISERNEALADAAKDSERANKEIQARSAIQLENADLREEVAKLTRKTSELSEKLAKDAKNHYDIEKENEKLREDVRERDEAINSQKKAIEKALKHNKLLYKALEKHGIYEVDDKGNLIIHN